MVDLSGSGRVFGCTLRAPAEGATGCDNAQRSICSARLAGEKLVRLVYLDEAGISNPQHEPYLVIAGVMIDADAALARIERYLNALVATQIPPEMQPGFVFHATELWSGTKRFKDRDRWPREKRWILEILCDIPQKFDLQVSFGFVERAKAISPDGRSLVSLGLGFTPEIEQFCVAFTLCGMFIEGRMRQIANEEVALLIAEDTDKVKRFVKASQAMLKNPQLKMAVSSVPEENQFFPFRHIKDTIHFATKSESISLQIADLCAFFIKRRLMKREQSDPFFKQIEPQLVWRPPGVL